MHMYSICVCVTRIVYDSAIPESFAIVVLWLSSVHKHASLVEDFHRQYFFFSYHLATDWRKSFSIIQRFILVHSLHEHISTFTHSQEPFGLHILSATAYDGGVTKHNDNSHLGNIK